VWCLTPDRLSRSYAYQVLISDELARHGVSISYLDAPAIDSDPRRVCSPRSNRSSPSMSGPRSPSGAVAANCSEPGPGRPWCWRAPFGYLRVPREGGRPAHLVINEEQAAVVRRIFADYTTGGLSLRQITLALNKEGIRTPTGKY